MNKLFLSLAIALALCLTAGGARASDQKIKILNDNELAAIKGGYCFLQTCESYPGTGICQPFPPIPEAVCAFTFCQWTEEVDGQMVIDSCGFMGPITCTDPTTYQQCVLSFTQSTCLDGPITPCGFCYVPACHVDRVDRICVCTGQETNEPCDWSNCVSGP
jgi:bacteriocin-like protein